MSSPSSPDKALLVIGILMQDRALFKETLSELEKLCGEFLFISRWYNFDQTKYYEEEMGNSLSRRFIAFKDLIHQDELKDLKLASYKIEELFSINEKRQVNVDPGYLTLDKLVLSTGKNFSHRIYLGDGIFADLTFVYKGNRFVFFDWTYPDYMDDTIVSFFLKLRHYLKNGINKINGESE